MRPFRTIRPEGSKTEISETEISSSSISSHPLYAGFFGLEPTSYSSHSPVAPTESKRRPWYEATPAKSPFQGDGYHEAKSESTSEAIMDLTEQIRKLQSLNKDIHDIRHHDLRNTEVQRRDALLTQIRATIASWDDPAHFDDDSDAYKSFKAIANRFEASSKQLTDTAVDGSSISSGTVGQSITTSLRYRVCTINPPSASLHLSTTDELHSAILVHIFENLRIHDPATHHDALKQASATGDPGNTMRKSDAWSTAGSSTAEDTSEFDEEAGSSTDVSEAHSLMHSAPYADLLHRLMICFSSVFHERLRQTHNAAGRIKQHQNPESDSKGTSSDSAASKIPVDCGTKSRAPTGKRQRSSRTNKDQDESEPDDDPARVDPIFPQDYAARVVKFACPYFKRNRIRYQSWRSCPGPGWDTVHRLKEHLYRCHALPTQCDRCGSEFDTEDILKGHRRLPQACEVRNFVTREGLTSEQEIRLRSRKRVKKGETEEEKWHRVYSVLFPYDDPAARPTPYYNVTEDSGPIPNAYLEFLRFEMPPQMQQELAMGIELELRESPEGLDERLAVRLPTIVHSVHRRLFRIFERSRTAVQHAEDPDQSSLASPFVAGDRTADPTSDQWADQALSEWFPIDLNTFVPDATDFDPTFDAGFSFISGPPFMYEEAADVSFAAGEE